MAREVRRMDWYGVNEETLRWLVILVLAAVVVGSAGVWFSGWQDRSELRRAVEVLERARGLMDVVTTEGGRESHAKAYAEAVEALAGGRRAREAEDYRRALSNGEVSRGLLVSILDSIRNPGQSGDARFIYVEGVVELRRGETGAFRQARARDLMYEGDYVRSGNGSAEILFGNDGALFTVRPDTLLKINRTHESVGEPQSVGIRYGWVDLATADSQGKVQTEFAELTVENQSDASVALVRGSDIGRFAVQRGTASVASAETGETVKLTELQQVVHEEGVFQAASRLPGPPRIVGPDDEFDINLDRETEINLAWEAALEAGGTYHLQVSGSRLFTENVIDVEGRSKNSARLRAVGEGNFYWRVAQVSSSGTRSPWSPVQRFRVASMGGVYWEDTVPPELTIKDVYVNGRILIVTGKTEPGALLEIDGRPFTVDADGSFSRSITHEGTVGLVSLTVTAIDDSGNRSVEERQVLIESQ